MIGEDEVQERGVVGETPNLAARLQALAAPNALVIADSTRAQIGGLFDLEDLGRATCRLCRAATRLAGVGRKRGGKPVRGVALRGRRRSSGVTRKSSCLLRRWEQAKSGEGRVVLISGEPGIGKSRLTAALSEHIENRAAYAPALFLLAAPPGQRALSVHRPARTRRRVCPRRHGRSEARQTAGTARAGHAAMTTISRC